MKFIIRGYRLKDGSFGFSSPHPRFYRKKWRGIIDFSFDPLASLPGIVRCVHNGTVKRTYSAKCDMQNGHEYHDVPAVDGAPGETKREILREAVKKQIGVEFEAIDFDDDTDLQVGDIVELEIDIPGVSKQGFVSEVIQPAVEYDGLDQVPTPKIFAENLGYAKLHLEEIGHGVARINDDIVIDLNEESYSQLYFDGECKKENLKKDEAWSRQVMDVGTIHRKELKDLAAIEDAELAKENPNVVELFRIMKKREDMKKYEDKQFYQMALENLNKRVQQGKQDKPIIREKLIQKISDLS